VVAAAAVAGIGAFLCAGFAVNLHNKASYLAMLKRQQASLAKDALELEEIESRFKMLSASTRAYVSVPEVILALHRAIPDEVVLLSVQYEEGGSAVIRGQAPELPNVFDFVARLRTTGVFKRAEPAVRYATKKRGPAGEVVDFEIACGKGRQ
jgi:Tfp pilus assembly protein PilN